MQGRLLMMPSSSQVLDHQLIFHIMYGLRQFHHRQNKGEERRGEGRFGKKSNSCLANIERKMCKKAAAASQIQRIGKIAKKQLTAATWLEDPCRSKSGNLDVVNNGLEQRRSNSRQSNSRGGVEKCSSQQLRAAATEIQQQSQIEQQK